MKNIANISNIVREELESNPATRNSDVTLFLAICRKLNPDACRMSFTTVWEHREELGLPKFETVSRCRRKEQELNPLLRATKEVEDARYENYKAVKEYAISQ